MADENKEKPAAESTPVQAIPFVHLHVHSDYSLLDGAAKCSQIVAAAAKMGMPAIAVTDHGNMSSCMELTDCCKENKIKPIYGCEFYVAPQDHKNRDPNVPHNKGYHLICLAETYEGYINMCHLNEEAWLQGYYYKPRVDKALLRQYSKGIICLSACLGGEVASHILEGRDDLAEKAIDEFIDIYGKDNFFIELQNHFLEEDKVVLPKLKMFAKEKGLQMVCTNDSHYMRKEDAAAQELFLCIGTQTTIHDPKHFKMPGGPEYYFKTPEEMAEIFKDTPEALSNTVKIAERCCNIHIPTVSDNPPANHYPAYPLPPDYKGTREEYLYGLCVEGMMERYKIDLKAGNFTKEQQVYVDRMNYELGIIAQMGFTSYYLVVWDFLHFARMDGVPLGPGRGSGAGSIVAYLIHITDIDPIKYKLLFERFLNPERCSPPDFDIDLCERRRGRVIEYVHRRYGEGNVVQIGTFGTLKPKAVVKDVARALGRTFEEGNRVCKLIPADPNIKTLDIALNGNPKKEIPPNPELKALIENEPWVQEIWKYAKVLEGMNRNMSMHAAGVIICDTRVSNVCPISRGADGEPTTQFPAVPDEHLGLLKMDFLGLRNLTIIQDALDLIKENTGRHLESSTIPDDDPKAYALLNKGDTVGVFQLESPGMQALCRQFHVNRLQDIIALIALFRPGPLQFKDEFIGRRNGTIPVVYEAPEMEPILNETCGIMLYQEQVMQVAQAVAGFSLGQADILRRAMGKKKIAIMEEMFSKFEKGALERGHSKETIKTIWDNIYKFAGYGFNKSHSAAYGLLSYRTAYLKANYPAEFFAAILTSELGNSEKMAFFLKECRKMNIHVLPPAVNICGKNFSVDGPDIRFGLAAIRGVGEAAVAGIIKAREEGGPFKNLDDFCQRVEGVNHKLLENLIKAGAMDCFGLKRSQLLAMIDQAIALGQQKRKDDSAGQLNMFEMLSTDTSNFNSTAVPDLPELPYLEMLSYEKELLGFFVSGHPIKEHQQEVDAFQSDDLGQLPSLAVGSTVRVGAFLAGVTQKTTKADGRPWVILNLETQYAHMECLFFPDSYARALKENPNIFQPGNIVFIDGETQKREDEQEQPMTLSGRLIYALEDMPQKFIHGVQIRLNEDEIQDETLHQLFALYKAPEVSGEVPLTFYVHCKDQYQVSLRNSLAGVRPTQEVLNRFRNIVGKENVYVHIDRQPVARPHRRFWHKS